MHSARKKLLGLMVLLLFLVPFGLAVKKVSREIRQPERNRSLIMAVRKNDTANVISLLAQGADPNARDSLPDTRSLWLRFWERLRGKPLPIGDGQTAMTAAVAPNYAHYQHECPPENVPLMKALLDAGGDANVSDDYMTPLLWTAIQAKRETVRLLLDHGANVRASSKDFHTALHYAVLQSDPAVVKLLLDHGAPVNARNGFSATPLHLATEVGQTANMRLLLAGGADVNARQADESTPLAVAVDYNEAGCVKLLLHSGAQVNPRDFRGETPLGSAKATRLRRFQGDNTKIIRILKQAGAKE